MKSKIYLLAILAVMFGLQSCDGYLDINEDPDRPVTVPAKLILPSATGSAVVFARGAQTSTLGGYWGQYYTQAIECGQYQDIDSYAVSTDWADRLWTEVFAGALIDYKNIYNHENTNAGYQLIAESMSCYLYQYLVDMFDEVPYTEALQGIDNFTPRFDSGKVIYADLIARLNAAVDAYNANPDGLVENDVIFGNNMSKWVQFANTVKMRLMLRASFESSDHNDHLVELATGNVLTSSAAFAEYVDVIEKRNPIFENEKSSNINCDNWMASASLLDYLKNSGDIRMAAIYTPNVVAGDYTGNAQGAYNTPGDDNDNYSQSNITPTEASYLFTEAEVLLMRAEIHVRFGDAATAKSLYEAAITADYNMRGLNDSTGMAELAVIIGGGGAHAFPSDSEEQLKAIATQKWIALANVGMLEAYLERNRTGYPEFTPDEAGDGTLSYSVESAIGEKNPRRLWFPAVSVSSNGNTPAQPGGGLAEKVWWDVK